MWQNLYYKFKSYSTSPNSYVINSGIINVLNVARPLLTALVLLNISESILGRDCINAPNVAKLLIGTQFLLHICKFILKRNLINVQNVAKPLVIVVISLNISEHTLESDGTSDGRCLP